jgi:GT2 family glycosyltransferase
MQNLHNLPDRPKEIIVVDNGSREDETKIYNALNLPEVVTLRIEKNAGYAPGANAGIRRALAGACEHILLLNNDAVVEPGCLTRLSAALEDESCGAACPLVVNMDNPDTIHSAGGVCIPAAGVIANRLKGKHRSAAMRPATVSFAPGSAVLIKREAFEKAGLIPERWYLYCEDVEFSLNLAKHGMAIAYVPEAVAAHAEGSTMRKSQQNYFYYWRNRLLFLHEYARGRAKVTTILSSLGTMLLLIIVNLLHRELRRSQLLFLAAVAGLRKDWTLGMTAANAPGRL